MTELVGNDIKIYGDYYSLGTVEKYLKNKTKML